MAPPRRGVNVNVNVYFNLDNNCYGSLIFAAISEHKIAKQDEEWMKEDEKKWKKK